MELVQTYVLIFIKLMIISNFLAFFLLLFLNFSLLDPDPGEMMRIQGDQDPQPWPPI